MLQLDHLNTEARATLARDWAIEPRWRTLDELEARVDRRVAELRQTRQALARRRGPLARLAETADRRFRIDREEFLDRSDCPADVKMRIVRALHEHNIDTLSYEGFMLALSPQIRRISEAQGRPARILELASGSGEFTLALARMIRDQGLPAEITGSDIVEAYVRDGNARASDEGLDVRFRSLNAFHMTDIEPGAFDLFFIAQTLHHFTPGQLARVAAESHRVADHGLLAIDLRRGALVFGAMAPFCALGSFRARTWKFAHDSVVSISKLYTDAELQLIADEAAPGAVVDVEPILPAHVALTVLKRPHPGTA